MKYTPAIFLICAVIFGVIFFRYAKPQAPTAPIQKNAAEIKYARASKDMIEVVSPLPGSFVEKNFSITGTARGPWFFEASFPVEVIGYNGEKLVQIPASAKSEWMTTNFVPFQADIKLPESYVGPVTIVLRKDNPSGLPENDASISFDVLVR